MRLIAFVIGVFILSKCTQSDFVSDKSAGSKLPLWQKGYLDIHHINTASGDATFFIFPDGTTMLFDAGDIEPPKSNPEFFFLKTREKMSAAQIIVNYIKAVHPDGKNTEIDYAVISHFHDDHYGRLKESSKYSSLGAYRLNGITEVGEYLKINVLIDRAYPDYNTPDGLKEYYSNRPTFANYLSLVAKRDSLGQSNQSLKVGLSNQIKLKDASGFPLFQVRNLKSNLETWKGTGKEITKRNFDFSSYVSNHSFNENPLSIALLIKYGDFEYFTGGDVTGFDWRNLLDVETPLAKAIGEVDVMAMNHHGYLDANNEYFMRTLNPKVVINQSRHDPHFQFNPMSRVQDLGSDFYTTNLHETVAQVFNNQLSSQVKGSNGHIVIRVALKGSSYSVYLLEDDDFSLGILSETLGYKSRN